MRPLPISKTRSDDVRLLCTIGAQKIDDAEAQLASSPIKFLRLEQYSNFLAQILEEEEAIHLSTWSVQLRRLADSQHVPVQEVIASLRQGVKEYGWNEDELLSFDDISGSLEHLISNPKVELVIKASDLYYMHKYHLHDIKIVSDIRPVLSDTRISIEAAIVKNLLILNYSNGSEEDKVLEVAVSYSELIRVREEIDRAIKKTELLSRLAEEKLEVPVMIYGSDNQHA